MQTPNADDNGRYLILNGKQEPLLQHPTDFTVIGESQEFRTEYAQLNANTKQVATNIVRVSADEAQRDTLMSDVRKRDPRYVAHHIYTFEDTKEEVIIDDRILLTLRDDSRDELDKIKEEYHLEDAGRMGAAYVLRVTSKTNRNPVKTANAISKREGVVSCSPQILIPVQRSQAPDPAGNASLFKRQWPLAFDDVQKPEVLVDAGINVKPAWLQFGFGRPDVVIAVIDDGFNLSHPAFQDKKIDPNQKDFVEGGSNTESRGSDIHGTPVASIATASRFGGAMVGVAPDCTLLPIRINLDTGAHIAPVDLFNIFLHASDHADVANCSFSSKPTEKNLLQDQFVAAITELTVSGGRDHRGLVIVFGAGNDDAPTNLAGAENKNGVWFVDAVGFLKQIPPGRDVNTHFPMIPGVVVVGATTSLKRKAGYSNWGEKLTLTAPSNNFHGIANVLDGVNDAVRAKFIANYPGQILISGTNRPGHGDNFHRLPDDPSTPPPVNESFYTDEFGGTSGAAPIVTGVVALMLSVKRGLSAKQVIEILKSTADKKILDLTLDLPDDPNLQGTFKGNFVDGRSPLFGAGKVNAFEAVKKASETTPEPPFP